MRAKGFLSVFPARSQARLSLLSSAAEQRLSSLQIKILTSSEHLLSLPGRGPSWVRRQLTGRQVAHSDGGEEQESAEVHANVATALIKRDASRPPPSRATVRTGNERGSDQREKVRGVRGRKEDGLREMGGGEGEKGILGEG